MKIEWKMCVCLAARLCALNIDGLCRFSVFIIAFVASLQALKSSIFYSVRARDRKARKSSENLHTKSSTAATDYETLCEWVKMIVWLWWRPELNFSLSVVHSSAFLLWKLFSRKSPLDSSTVDVLKNCVKDPFSSNTLADSMQNQHESVSLASIREEIILAVF